MLITWIVLCYSLSEVDHFQKVLEHPAFKADPLPPVGALQLGVKEGRTEVQGDGVLSRGSLGDVREAVGNPRVGLPQAEGAGEPQHIAGTGGTIVGVNYRGDQHSLVSRPFLAAYFAAVEKRGCKKAARGGLGTRLVHAYMYIARVGRL